MKIFFLILLTISVCAVNCFSQSETIKAADWKTFTPQNEEFSVEVPIPLTASIVPNPSAAFLTSPGSKRSVEDKDKNTESRRYLNSLDGTYFYVFSDDWKEPAQFRYVLNFVYDQNQIETTQNTGELTTKKYEFPDSWDFYHIVLTVNAKNRVYIFHTISPTKENSMVERFFGSIKFDEKTLLEISSGAKTDKSMTVTIPTADQEKTDTAPPGKTIISNGGVGIPPPRKTKLQSPPIKSPPV